VLADRGIRQQTGLWTGTGRVWLAELELAPVPRAIVEDYLALLDGLAEPIVGLEHQIATLAKPDPRVQALMTLPGVGRLTAMTLVAEIGDIGRFPTAGKLCAWAGLTPAVRNSDRKIRHGHITKQGSPWVRWILQEAAQTAKRSPAFATTYAQLARRRGKQIATVAIARRLLARCFHLLNQLEAATTGEGQTGCAPNNRMRLPTRPLT
jgi:transposase